MITSRESCREIVPVDFQKQWLEYQLVLAVILLFTKNARKILKLGRD